jgi:hypothetical protein
MAPTVAVAGWRAVPTTGFVTDERALTLTKRLTSLWIMSDLNGDQHFIYQTVPTVEGDVIDALAVCYRGGRLSDTGASLAFITAIGLAEFLGPLSSASRHVDDTDLTSPTDSCHVSPVANYTPAGAVSLWLRLNFRSLEETILVGGVFVHVK